MSQKCKTKACMNMQAFFALTFSLLLFFVKIEYEVNTFHYEGRNTKMNTIAFTKRNSKNH